MTRCVLPQRSVLSLAPCVRGIGFIFFDESGIPLDWGILWTTDDKNAVGLKKVTRLLNAYRPDIIAIESLEAAQSKRAPRIYKLLASISELAKDLGIEVSHHDRVDAQRLLWVLGSKTKHEVACELASAFPELRPHLPAKRKIWLPESANMSIFDATVLALAHYSDVARGSP